MTREWKHFFFYAAFHFFVHHRICAVVEMASSEGIFCTDAEAKWGSLCSGIKHEWRKFVCVLVFALSSSSLSKHRHFLTWWEAVFIPFAYIIKISVITYDGGHSESPVIQRKRERVWANWYEKILCIAGFKSKQQTRTSTEKRMEFEALKPIASMLLSVSSFALCEIPLRATSLVVLFSQSSFKALILQDMFTERFFDRLCYDKNNDNCAPFDRISRTPLWTKRKVIVRLSINNKSEAAFSSVFPDEMFLLLHLFFHLASILPRFIALL